MITILLYRIVSILVQVSIEYDYIVVGGGTSGGTLAAELAKKGFKTLLLEAGQTITNKNITVPGLHPRATEDSSISLDYYVKHYENGKKVLYPRSTGLGGCSLHNAMISIYPNKRDFDAMKRLTKDESWNEKNMRNYFNKMTYTSYSIESTLFDNINNNKEKWFPISYTRFFRTLTLDFNLIGVADHFTQNIYRDLNSYDQYGRIGADLEGNAFIPINVDENMVRGNYVSYLQSVSKKYPLEIRTNTLVTRIIFSKEIANKAIGVEYVKGKYLYKASPLSNKNLDYNKLEKFTIYASKEIIISAGAFNTPQLLMLSGIGNKTELGKHGIKLIKDLPGVGINLQDRYEIPVVIQYEKYFTSLVDCILESNFNDICYDNYASFRTGPYIGNGILSATLKKSNTSLNEPDIIILNLIGDFHGYERGWSNKYSKSFNRFTQLILKARSRNNMGTIKLKSKDPLEQPEINFNYFKKGRKDDLNVIVKQIKQQRISLKSSPLKHIEVMPGLNVKTDHELEDYVMNKSWGHHACCTAKMGIDNDKFSVVDKNFKVFGVQGLRVVDASIFPDIPGFFPCLYIHMIAMKAADDITKKSK